MARKRATVEFLERLVEWAGGKKTFCDLTGIKSSNLSDYLNSKKSISWRRIETAAREVLGEPPAFVPIIEGFELRDGLPSVTDLPRMPGLYALFDSAMRVLYFGKASSLYAEVRQTLSRKVAEVRPWTGAHNLTFRQISAFLSAYEVKRSDAKLRHDIESFGLRLMVNNTFNKRSGNFSRKR